MAIVTELRFFLHAASCHCTNNNDSVYTHPNENWCGPCDLLHGLLVLCAAKTHVQWICRGVTNCFQTRSILQATGFLLLPCMGLFNSSYSSKSPVFVARCFSLDSSNILWDRLQSWTTEVCFPIRFFFISIDTYIFSIPKCQDSFQVYQANPYPFPPSSSCNITISPDRFHCSKSSCCSNPWHFKLIGHVFI